jgi:hypothetical protein
MYERSVRGLVHLPVRVIRRETPKAFSVCLEDGRIWWLPKSQVHNADEYQAGDRDCVIAIPDWLFEAKEKQA